GRLADTNLPDDEETPVPVRYMGLLIRGRVSAWRGDAAGTVRFFERAARYADQMDWADPGVRNRLDIPLAEAYVAVGRPHDAGRISAWLREIGGRLGRPALTGDAHRIDALAAARAGGLDAAGEAARGVAAASGAGPQPARARPDRAAAQGPQAIPLRPGAGPRAGCRDGPPATAGPDRTGAAAGRGGEVSGRADRRRAAGSRPGRRRRDQPGRRGGVVRQRAHRRDARRLDLPQAGRANPRGAGPQGICRAGRRRAGSVVLRIGAPQDPPQAAAFP